MPSNRPIDFDVAELRQQVIDYHEGNVTDAKKALDEILDEEHLKQQREEWRRDRLQRLAAVKTELGEMSASELRDWLGSIARLDRGWPEVDHWDVRSAKQRVGECERSLDRAKRTFEAIAGKKETLSLTSAQLRDFFGIRQP